MMYSNSVYMEKITVVPFYLNIKLKTILRFQFIL